MGCRTVKDVGELELVDRILDKLGSPGRGVRVGAGDDAAVLAVDGCVVLTTDSQHEAVHFRREWIEPEALGRRSIAVNASDLGAMGARPRGFLVALALPDRTELDWVVRLADGLRQGAARFGASILGGDVAAVADRVVINVTAVGQIDEATTPVERKGAVAGSQCFVTGWPGRAAAGRRALQADRGSSVAFASCVEAFLDPKPPVVFGGAAAGRRFVDAMIDVSDGLAMDLARMCRASGVGARLEAESLLADPTLNAVAAELRLDPVELVLGGGEDYELLCSVADEKAEAFCALAAAEEIEVRSVGRFVAVDGIALVRDGRTEPLAVGGWDHFA